MDGTWNDKGLCTNIFVVDIIPFELLKIASLIADDQTNCTNHMKIAIYPNSYLDSSMRDQMPFHQSNMVRVNPWTNQPTQFVNASLQYTIRSGGSCTGMGNGL